MKIIRKLLAFSLVMMILLCSGPVVPHAQAGAKGEISVKISFDKSSYAAGTPIKVSYEIAGGSGSYKDLYYYCYSVDNGTLVEITDGSLTGAKGSFTFSAKVGQEAYVFIGGYDTENRQFEKESEHVTITGSVPAPMLTADISFEKSTYAANTAITAKYEITGGSGTYPLIEYRCCSEDNGTQILVKSGKLTAATGTVTFSVQYGQTAYIQIDVKDSDGRYTYLQSESVSITGGAHITPVDVSFSFEKSSYPLNSAVTAGYTVSGGSGSYKNLWYRCFAVDGSAEILVSEGDLTAAKGSVTFTPKAGQKAFIIISGEDASLGIEFNKESEQVALTAAPAPASPAPADPAPSDPPSGQPQNEPAEATEQVTLKKVKISKVSAVSKKKIKVSWKKLSSKTRKKVKQIQIQVAADKAFQNIVSEKYVKSSKTSVSVSGLKKNTKYYVRIRAYTEDGGSRYVSPWSSVKKVKTKK